MSVPGAHRDSAPSASISSSVAGSRRRRCPRSRHRRPRRVFGEVGREATTMLWTLWLRPDWTADRFLATRHDPYTGRQPQLDLHWDRERRWRDGEGRELAPPTRHAPFIVWHDGPFGHTPLLRHIGLDRGEPAEVEVLQLNVASWSLLAVRYRYIRLVVVTGDVRTPTTRRQQRSTWTTTASCGRYRGGCSACDSGSGWRRFPWRQERLSSTLDRWVATMRSRPQKQREQRWTLPRTSSSPHARPTT